MPKREKKCKDGFECKRLRRIAIDNFDKFRLNFSKLSYVTELFTQSTRCFTCTLRKHNRLFRDDFVHCDVK